MRSHLMGLALVLGVIGPGGLGLGDRGLASVYVPGQIRDGVYIRPHFIAGPPADQQATAGAKQEPPLMGPPPRDPEPASESF